MMEIILVSTSHTHALNITAVSAVVLQPLPPVALYSHLSRSMFYFRFNVQTLSYFFVGPILHDHWRPGISVHGNIQQDITLYHTEWFFFFFFCGEWFPEYEEMLDHQTLKIPSSTKTSFFRTVEAPSCNSKQLMNFLLTTRCHTPKDLLSTIWYHIPKSLYLTTWYHIPKESLLTTRYHIPKNLLLTTRHHIPNSLLLTTRYHTSKSFTSQRICN